jgi:peroxiredoxin family protein
MIEILTYVATFSPGVAAIGAIVFFLFWGLKQLKDVVSVFKSDANTIAAKDQEMIDKLSRAIDQNEDLRKQNKILAETLTHIDNYLDEKMKEREANDKK